MKHRIKSLVLEGNGAQWRSVTVDTVLRGVIGFTGDESILPPRLRRFRLAHKLLGQRYENMSYVIDWREAFCRAPELQVELCNINNLIGYARVRDAIEQYPLLVILHSATGDSMSVLLRTASWFQKRRGKLVVFIGNEYDLITEKLKFLQVVQADYVCSQLPIEAARWLYSSCQRTKVVSMPHGLNPRLYCERDDGERPTDVGFRGNPYPLFIGDTERDDLVRFFQTRGSTVGLQCDIGFARLVRTEWSHFLTNCRGIVGAEAGSYYLDREGQVIRNAKAYLARNTSASLDDVLRHCFQDLPEHVSGKCISSRHFEAIGTKTCQILVEGHYNGILLPDEHYICVKRDLSNINDAVRRLKDEQYRRAMVERTYRYVLAGHTYRHRVESLLQTVLADEI